MRCVCNNDEEYCNVITKQYTDLESVQSVSSVGDGPDPAVGIGDAVAPPDDVAVSLLLPGLGVSGRRVSHAVSKLVL